jgi:hypothetical protein
MDIDNALKRFSPLPLDETYLEERKLGKQTATSKLQLQVLEKLPRFLDAVGR